MLLTSSPLLVAASYITPAQMRAMPSDYDLAPYTDTQLQSILSRVSGAANSIMRRSLLAAERTEVFYGDGSNCIDLGARPLIYIKQMQFTQPGNVGFIIPADRVMIDYLKGQVIQYNPLELQGIGMISVFPRGLPVAFTYARGYGYNPVTPPVWTAADASASIDGLAPGTYTIAIAAATQWGESLPLYQTVTTATGFVRATIAPVLGAWKYRAFIAAGGMTTLTAPLIAGANTVHVASASALSVGQTIVLDPMTSSSGTGTAQAEPVTITGIAGAVLTTTPVQYPHASGALVSPQTSLVCDVPFTTFNGEPSAATIGSLTPPAGYVTEAAPLVDSSQLPTPWEIAEGTRLLALSSIFEQNNLANRGVAGTQSDRKRVLWRSTEGSGGRGVPTLWQQAESILKPKMLSGIF
jgi:hypothetical protein